MSKYMFAFKCTVYWMKQLALEITESAQYFKIKNTEKIFQVP